MHRALEQREDGRVLGDPGRVHDDDVVRGLGDDAEVVRDQDHGGPALRLQLADQVEDLRLRRDVERRRRLVGDEKRGLVDERHRDHHALAHAARELVRVVVDAPLGPRDADLLRAPRSRAPAPRAAVTSRCSITASTSWLPTESTGLSDVIGSWKIIEISLPRSARSRRFDASSRFSPRNSACPVETDVCFFDAVEERLHPRPGRQRRVVRDAPRASGSG